MRRAYDLRLIDAASYQRAYKYMATQGWLKGEPEEPPDEQPELVILSLAQLEKHLQAKPLDVCKALEWSAGTFETVTGVKVPAYEPPRADRGVVQLALIRAERAANPRRRR